MGLLIELDEVDQSQFLPLDISEASAPKTHWRVALTSTSTLTGTLRGVEDLPKMG